MTIQGKIDEIVLAVENALKECPIPEGDREYILNGVKELGFQWQEANAHGRAACILMGLIDGHYNPDLCRRFVKECVELKQFDELQAKENAGSVYNFRMIPMPYYAALIDLLMVQAIEDGAGEYQEKSGSEDGEKKRPPVELVYDPAIADEYRAEQVAKAGKEATVEVVEKVPDVDAAKAGQKATEKKPAQKQAGVKTAARVAAAGKKTVAQTKKKATRAADGK